MASVRTRSASPKSVSFSPVLERKYTVDCGPSSPPELSCSDWRRYFSDFSSYLGEYSERCDLHMIQVAVYSLTLCYFDLVSVA